MIHRPSFNGRSDRSLSERAGENNVAASLQSSMTSFARRSGPTDALSEPMHSWPRRSRCPSVEGSNMNCWFGLSSLHAHTCHGHPSADQDCRGLGFAAAGARIASRHFMATQQLAFGPTRWAHRSRRREALRIHEYSPCSDLEWIMHHQLPVCNIDTKVRSSQPNHHSTSHCVAVVSIRSLMPDRVRAC